MSPPMSCGYGQAAEPLKGQRDQADAAKPESKERYILEKCSALIFKEACWDVGNES